MASFTHRDYRKVFEFASETFAFAPDDSSEKQATLIMYMVEECIGQQRDFPPMARELYPTKEDCL